MHFTDNYVIDDNGKEILLINTTPRLGTSACRIVGGREGLYDELAALIEGNATKHATEPQAEVRHLLEELGLLLPQAPAPYPSNHNVRLVRLTINTNSPDVHTQGALSELRHYLLGLSLETTPSVEVRIVGDEPLSSGLPTILRTLYEELDGPNSSIVTCEIVTPLTVEPDILFDLLDQYPSLRCVFDDRTESQVGEQDFASSMRRLEALGTRGYPCPAEIQTQFCPGLQGRIETILLHSERAGIRIHPAAGNPSLDPGMASAFLLDFTDRIADILHLCEPWNQVLSFAVVGCRVRGVQEVSTLNLYLRDGCYYPGVTCEAPAPIEDLDGARLSKYTKIAGGGGQLDPGQLNCASCGLVRLCMGQREGVDALAHGVANASPCSPPVAEYKCLVNSGILTFLLDELRGRLAELSTSCTKSRVQLDNGVVHYVSSA